MSIAILADHSAERAAALRAFDYTAARAYFDACTRVRDTCAFDTIRPTTGRLAALKRAADLFIGGPVPGAAYWAVGLTAYALESGHPDVVRLANDALVDAANAITAELETDAGYLSDRSKAAARRAVRAAAALRTTVVAAFHNPHAPANLARHEAAQAFEHEAAAAAELRAAEAGDAIAAYRHADTLRAANTADRWSREQIAAAARLYPSL